jgi:phage terminase large subunit-like protein
LPVAKRPVKPKQPAPPPSDGPFVIEFIETFCRHTKGDKAGELIVLAPWQRDLFIDLMRLRADGSRQYREACIGIPRKNSKSTMCAGLGLYLLLADGEKGAEVYSCAGDKEQARIVFGDAKKMVEADSELSQLVKLYRDAIEDKVHGGVYRVVSAEAYTKEGLNPSGVIFDELHVQPNRELWDVMRLGSGTRRQPLVVAITTAGYDVEGTICGEVYRHGKKVQSGEIADPSFFFRWWEPKRADCDWRDPSVWFEANPALGDFLRLDALEDDARKLPENVFRRYHLNSWTTTVDAWLPYGSWEACRDDALDLDASLPVKVGIDVALYNDSTAVVTAQKRAGRTIVRAKVWENPYPEGHSQRDSWELNIFEVEDYLRELYQRFPAPACEVDGEIKAGPEFDFDPAFFHRSANVLAGEGLAMVRFSQHDSLMVPASQTLYQLIVEGNLAHDGDPILARHIGNAVADQKPRGWRLTKPKGSRRKIDAAIACAIAAYQAQSAPPEVGPSVYEERGVLFV